MELGAVLLAVSLWVRIIGFVDAVRIPFSDSESVEHSNFKNPSPIRSAPVFQFYVVLFVDDSTPEDTRTPGIPLLPYPSPSGVKLFQDFHVTERPSRRYLDYIFVSAIRSRYDFNLSSVLISIGRPWLCKLISQTSRIKYGEVVDEIAQYSDTYADLLRNVPYRLMVEIGQVMVNDDSDFNSPQQLGCVADLIELPWHPLGSPIIGFHTSNRGMIASAGKSESWRITAASARLTSAALARHAQNFNAPASVPVVLPQEKAAWRILSKTLLVTIPLRIEWEIVGGVVESWESKFKVPLKLLNTQHPDGRLRLPVKSVAADNTNKVGDSGVPLTEILSTFTDDEVNESLHSLGGWALAAFTLPATSVDEMRRGLLSLLLQADVGNGSGASIGNVLLEFFDRRVPQTIPVVPQFNFRNEVEMVEALARSRYWCLTEEIVHGIIGCEDTPAPSEGCLIEKGFRVKIPSDESLPPILSLTARWKEAEQINVDITLGVAGRGAVGQPPVVTFEGATRNADQMLGNAYSDSVNINDDVGGEVDDDEVNGDDHVEQDYNVDRDGNVQEHVDRDEADVLTENAWVGEDDDNEFHDDIEGEHEVEDEFHDAHEMSCQHHLLSDDDHNCQSDDNSDVEFQESFVADQ